jgi:hypothetical protein
MATQTRDDLNASARTYLLQGALLEACSCNVLCPCWIGENPDNGTCEAITAYHIEDGQIGGVDVSGLTVLEVQRIPGNVLAGNIKTVRYVDERATPEQVRAVADAFQGRLGGPLADLAALTSEDLGLFQAPIECRLDRGKGALSVGDKIRAVMAPYKGPDGAVTTLRDTLFSTIPGSPAYVAKASEHTVSLPEHGMTWSFRGRNAIQGEFSLEA